MTDHWGDWPTDQPDFDGADDGGFDDLDPGQTDGDGYPIEEFGAADPDPGPPTEQPGPIGYDGFGADPPRFDPYAEADPYAGYGPDGPSEVPAEVGFGPADPPVGADPDLDPYADTAQWSEPVWAAPSGEGLPPPPEPVDGFPWADPGLLGEPVGTPEEAVTPYGSVAVPEETAVPEELADYAGERLPPDGDPWSTLAASEDPATSTLARFWSPEDR